jgi:uncharacterized membrane protein
VTAFLEHGKGAFVSIRSGVLLIYKNPVRAAKETQLFTVTKINRLTLFKEIIAVYSENQTEHMNTKRRVADS